MSNLRTMKYLVSLHRAGGQLQIGYTRDWKYHFDIQATFEKDFKPFSGGHFSAELDGLNWKTDTLKVFGRSDGYNLEPNHRDFDLLKKMLDAENRGELLNTFPLESWFHQAA